MANKKRISWFIQWIYATWVRDIIWKEIDNPNSNLDERIMKLLDKLFKYKQ